MCVFLLTSITQSTGIIIILIAIIIITQNVHFGSIWFCSFFSFHLSIIAFAFAMSTYLLTYALLCHSYLLVECMAWKIITSFPSFFLFTWFGFTFIVLWLLLLWKCNCACMSLCFVCVSIYWCDCAKTLPLLIKNVYLTTRPVWFACFLLLVYAVYSIKYNKQVEQLIFLLLTFHLSLPRIREHSSTDNRLLVVNVLYMFVCLFVYIIFYSILLLGRR